MDSVILAEKLEALRKCVRRLEEKRASSPEALRDDIDRQDIVTLNLTRAVQLCVDMATHVLAATDVQAPATMGDSFDGLERLGLIDSTLCQRLKAAVGFRNVAVHNYQQIDWDMVHAITWQHLDDFRHFAEVINSQMADR